MNIFNNTIRFGFICILCNLYSISLFSQQENESSLYAPNSYIVYPGNSISIPVQKAFGVWQNIQTLKATAPDLSENVSAELLWQDTPGLISGVQVDDTSASENALINVTTNSKSGNAVVCVKVGNVIRWSWHIWVTDYLPDNQNIEYDTEGRRLTFMSMNLGAISWSANDHTSYGLLYQYGRKDPFPASKSDSLETNYSFGSDTIYDISNNILNSTAEKVTAENNLANTITNPLSFYFGNSANVNDWYSVNDVHNDTLWSGTNGRKGIFDPSPEGWRVPSSDQIPADLPMVINDVFSMGGSRDYTDGSFFMTGNYGMYWSATPNSPLAYYMFLSEPLTETQSSHYRANGYAIRCIKDDGSVAGIVNMENSKSPVVVSSENKEITVLLQDNLYTGALVCVYNINGILLSKVPLNSSRTIVTSNVAPGIYFVRIYGAENFVTKILVK
ncbi:MAG: T9SS type A sorting domain-containing protein [Paludibacter sp.]|nr:T9SS type A sorting domain-containing protein [Paludibacter sp.]